MTMVERGVERVRHHPKFRLAAVVEAQLLTPRMRRIVFHSDEFSDFRSAAYDDHIRLYLPMWMSARERFFGLDVETISRPRSWLNKSRFSALPLMRIRLSPGVESMPLRPSSAFCSSVSTSEQLSALFEAAAV